MREYWGCSNGNAPSILVCTPRYLANFLQGPVNHEPMLFESIRHLVLDEVLYTR